MSRTDFEESGRRIGLPERVVKRELDAFAKENQMEKALIERSFLSDILKRQYWLSVDYRRKMLVWRFQKTVFTHQGVSFTQRTGKACPLPAPLDRLAHYHHIDNRLPDKKPVRLMWKK